MNSSKEITRDILKDQHLTFVCYHLSRGVRAKRPLSRRRRWVSANDCACTRDTKEICDPTRLYSFAFYETSDEEGEQMDLFEKDAPPDRIGVFDPDRGPTLIRVPTHFLDLLWNAGLAADGVLRSIEIIIQSQNRGGWAIFEASFNENYVEPFNWPLDKNLRPKVAPPPDGVIDTGPAASPHDAMIWPRIHFQPSSCSAECQGLRLAAKIRTATPEVRFCLRI